MLEVGDVWLDAGIVPFSTLGWQNPEWIPEGYATGAAKGLTTADLPDNAYWEKWFPADWVSEMREQIRLWFYSQFFMSCRARRPLAVQPRARLREDARRARPRDARLVGEHDRRRGRVRAHGRRRDALAVLRAAARPEPALRLRAGARDQAEAADVLELAPRSSSLTGTSRDSTPRASRPRDRPRRRAAARPLARRADARVRPRGRGRLRGDADRERDPGVRGVRRRPVELVHPPVAQALLGRRRRCAPRRSGTRSSSRCGSSRR